MTAAKSSPQIPVYLIHGENELEATENAKQIIRQAIPPEEETLGLEMINARADSVAEALGFLQQGRAALQTLGFLGGRKAVWLRNANFLDQGVIGKSKEVHARLQDLADAFQGGLPAGHFLVITTPDADGRSEFYRACKETGRVISVELDKPWQRDKAALAFAVRAFQELGLTAPEPVFRAFVEKAGTDSRQLRQEAEKLSLYLGQTRSVRGADIEAIISPARELFGWQLEDAIGNRDLAAALRILRQLFFQKEEPIKLFFGLESRFRSLVILREALDKRWVRISDRFMNKGAMTPAQEEFLYQTLNDNRLKNPYAAGLRARQAMAFTRQELADCRREILATRRRLVSSSLQPTLVMEMLLIKLCRKKARPEKGNHTSHENNRAR